MGTTKKNRINMNNIIIKILSGNQKLNKIKIKLFRTLEKRYVI